MWYVVVLKSSCCRKIMSALENLYYGDIKPCALSINQNATFKELLKTITASEKSLIEQFTDEERDLYDQLKNCDIRISDITQRDMFIQGFKLGARLMLEIMLEEK